MHHITHIDNLRNMLKERKIIAREFLEDNFTDTADHGIINSRENVDGRNLNEYVPFHRDDFQVKYCIPYNYRVCRDNGKENMIYLMYNSWKCTERNDVLYYAFHPTSIYKKECDSLLDLSVVMEDELKKLPTMQKKYLNYSSKKVQEYFMSEILIYEYVNFDDIFSIYVYNEDVQKKF